MNMNQKILFISVLVIAFLMFSNCSSFTIQPSSNNIIPTATTSTPIPIKTATQKISPEPLPSPSPSPTSTASPEFFNIDAPIKTPTEQLPVNYYVLENNNHIYYADGKILYCADLDMSHQEKLLTASGYIQQIFFDKNNVLYYIAMKVDKNGDTHYALYKHIESSEQLVLPDFDGIDGIDSNYIYYEDGEYNMVQQKASMDIYTYDINNNFSKEKWLSADNIDTCDLSYLQTGYLYFTIEDHPATYCGNLIDGTAKKIFPQDMAELGDNNHRIGFSTDEKNTYFSIYDYNDNSYQNCYINEVLNYGEIANILVYNNYLYIVVSPYYNDGSIYKIDIRNNTIVNKSLITGFCINSAIYGDKWYLFADGNGLIKNKLYEYNLDDCSLRILAHFKKFPTDNNSIESLDIAGDYIWGYGSLGKNSVKDKYGNIEYIVSYPVRCFLIKIK